MEIDDHAVVAVLLAQAGLTLPVEEVDELVKAYPVIRGAIASLYAVPTNRHEVPAFSFDPRVGEQ